MEEPARARVRVVIVMGVSGAGKSLVGAELARSIAWRFYDADDYHSPANIDKMAHAIPLSDEDRWPWLDHLRGLIADTLSHGDDCVLACSALKEEYRQRLIPPVAGRGSIGFVYLDVPKTVLEERLSHRRHHFAPPELLDSQLATLEKPRDALWVDGTKPPTELVQEIRAAFGI